MLKQACSRLRKEKLMIQNIKKICWGILGIAAFYILFMAVSYPFLPLFADLYIYTPFIFFALITFFFTMFLVRETACLVFMPKPRLKAIIHDGQAEISASQVVLKIFSWTFLKRISMYFGLFVLEIACRIFGIRLFLQCADAALSTLETLAAKSDMLLIAVITVAALILMELPWYFLFYRVSFGNRANRSSEYRFGLRVFAFLLGVLVVQFMLQPFSVYYADNAAVQYLLVGLLIVASFGIWWLMYKKRWKKGACPLCNRVKSCFCVYEQPATDETEKKAE